jgi:hypothetical protein
LRLNPCWLSAEQPQNDEHNQNEAEDPAESGAAVSAMRIISAAATEDDYQYYDYDNCAHGSVSGIFIFGATASAGVTAS